MSRDATARDGTTLGILKGKHPREDPMAIVQAKVTAETYVVDEPPKGAPPPVVEVDEPFEPNAFRDAIKTFNPQSALGPSGLRHYCHLQNVLDYDVSEDITTFSPTIWESIVLPPLFWAPHMRQSLCAGNQRTASRL